MNVTSDADANASFDANAAVLTRQQRRLVSLWARFSFVVVAVSFAGHSHIISALISLHRAQQCRLRVHAPYAMHSIFVRVQRMIQMHLLVEGTLFIL